MEGRAKSVSHSVLIFRSKFEPPNSEIVMAPTRHAPEDVYTSASPVISAIPDRDEDSIDAEIWRFFFAPIDDGPLADRRRETAK